MGTAATAATRSSEFINIKRQTFYVRPQASSTNRDEIITLWPRGEDSIKMLRDLNSFSQEQNELENNEASASKDPRKQDFGSFSPLTQTAPLYSKPVGLSQGDLPIEDPMLDLFFTANKTRKAGTDTIATVNSQTSFGITGDVSADYRVGMACYIGSGACDVRHIIALDFGVTTGGETTLVFNAATEETIVATDVIEAGPITYFFDDNIKIPLAMFVAQTDQVADYVSSMFIIAWNMEAANDGLLQQSFDVGGIKLFSGVQTNFRANRVDPIDTAVYSNITSTFDAGGSILANGAGSIGDTTLTIDDSVGAIDVAIPVGLVVKIDHQTTTARYYVTAAGGTTTSLALAEAVVLAVDDDDPITVYANGNWNLTTAQADGVVAVNTASAAIGDFTITISDSADGALANAPVAGTPVFIDGEVYETDTGSTTTSLALKNALETAPADDAAVVFATQMKVSFTDATRLGEHSAVINGESGSTELMWTPASGGTVVSGGLNTWVNWDITTDPQTIDKVWRGMEGTALQAINDYDDCDLYFPTPTSSDGSPIQARKEVATFIGDQQLTTKTVRIGINKNASADEEERSKDDFAGLPEDDVRDYTLEVEANYRPEFFAIRFDSKQKTTQTFQTTIGNTKGKRVSVFVPKAIFSEPTKEAGDLKMTTTITGKPYQDADVPAFYLSYV